MRRAKYLLKQTIFILIWISGIAAENLPVQSIKLAGSTVVFVQSLDWFDADLVSASGELTFYSSTEEGLLWHGKIDGGQLIATGVTKSAEKGGSIMDVSDDGDLIAVATHAIRLFKTR